MRPVERAVQGPGPVPPWDPVADGWVMRGDWLSYAARLHRDGRPFALATVIARRPPQSVPVGARAIIEPDGRMDGWIGGGCVRPTILREALEALADGRPRLVRVSPDEPLVGESFRTEKFYPMTCHGGGAVEVYIEPVLPAPRLIVFGTSPVAESLVRLADPLGFRIRVADPAASRDRFPLAEAVVTDVATAAQDAGAGDYAIVATMGTGDEEALEAALAGRAAYVGLVASRRKARALLEALEARGVERARLERVTCPAGLDLGGTSAAEIALSILAQVVATRAGRRAERAGADPVPESNPDLSMGKSVASIAPTTGESRSEPMPLLGHRPTPRSIAGLVSGRPPVSALVPSDPPVTGLDPVCGMAVEVAIARHYVTFEGRTFYFCCPRCKAAFERDPEKYTVVVG